MSDGSQAFNLGCDARLAGRPAADNPYGSNEYNLQTLWRQGWRDVDEHWGERIRGSVRRLPTVVQA